MASTNKNERLERALHDSRILYLNFNFDDQFIDSKERKTFNFEILGSTGTKYNVTCLFNKYLLNEVSINLALDRDLHVILNDYNNKTAKWKCTCPDYKKRKVPCKHIYFIHLKTLRLINDTKEYNDDIIYTNNTMNFYYVIFSMIERLPFCLESLCIPCTTINEKCYEKPKIIDYIANEYEDSKEYKNKVKDEEEEECCICFYEIIYLNNKEDLIQCKTCHKHIHKQCFIQWSLTSKNQFKSCPLCRSVINYE